VRTGSLIQDTQYEDAVNPLSARRIARAFRHAGMGALLGAVPFLISILMRPAYRSPYLFAYPAVVLSAWVWGLSGSIACAAVSGFLIEYFIFAAGNVNLAPSANGWVFREFVFLAGSLMVGVLTRSAARQRQRIATANLNQRLQLAHAEADAAIEKSRATELALENEVRSKLALDGANVGLWEWEIGAPESRWSDGFCRLHGLEPGTPINSKVRRQCVYPEDFDRVEQAVENAIAEAASFHEEYRVRLPAGEIRWVACQGAALTNPDGNVIKISGFGGDVTRRKLADLALLHNEKMAVAGRLIATIAHEINNPLDAAMNILFLIRSGVTQEEQAALLEEAALQLERISQISRHTLNFSNPSHRASLCRPSVLVDETMRLLIPKLRLAEIDVSTEVRGDSEFYCERREIQQILTNIINNAIEATRGPGRLHIRIADSVHWHRRTQPGVRITVADTGSGMTRDVMHRISEPFFTTKQDTGTGLGMWVARELIQKQSGDISIRSTTTPPHRGTTVSLFIPFAIEPAQAVATPPAAQSQPAL
jgi:PAS domain S-box-containing protein